MKKKQTLPYLFLAILAVTITFVGGLRYGRKVEETNKTITYLLNITPTKAVTPAPSVTVSYITYTNDSCGVSFVYPSTLKPVGTASESAKLNDGKKTFLRFTCGKTATITLPAESQFATIAAKIDGSNIDASESAQFGEYAGTTVFFAVRNPVNRKTVQFAVDKTLLPLVLSSIELE